MALIAFSATDYRAQFPGQFPDPPNTDTILELYWDTAICYISAEDTGALNGDCRRQAINYLTAHLITLAGEQTVGEQSGFIQNSQIDKVSITVQPPPQTTQMAFWYNQTPFGQHSYALLQTRGGTYFGAYNELGSFRRAGGRFIPATRGAAVAPTDTCGILSKAPESPFDLDFGTLDGSNLTLGANVLAGCTNVDGEFDGVASGVAVTLSIWSGTSVDSGNRFNIYYWTSDARQSGAAPTLIATNVDVTGLTIVDGFILTGIVTGTAGQNPNLIAIGGHSEATTQVLNVDIAVA